MLSPRHKWILRFIAIFLFPLLVIAGLELLLRVVGSGFNPDFFKRESVGGTVCYVSNEDFGLRFFPRHLARFPNPTVMPEVKAPGTCRVFIFGESAALGDPRPNYGAGSFLEVLLAERFPQTRFEVINTSMTAINSHVILPIARECAEHAGDLWIIYMGNNEMVGPFGAATVFGVRAPPTRLVRAQVQVQRLRLAQSLLPLAAGLRKSDAAAAGWGGMEMFVENQVFPNDPGRGRVYESFRRNLDDILKAGLDSGAKIVLSTVAVNLKDCAPFGSVSETNLPPSDRATFTQLFQEGAAAMAQGLFADARSAYEQASATHPLSAEARFQLATALLRLTNAPEARNQFLQAVDADILPFRADSKINESIRAAARRFAGRSLVLCDAAEALDAASPDGVAGEDLFYEHVHANPNGNYALALAWAQSVETMLDPAFKRDARSSWISQSECEERLGLTDWNRVSILEDILQRIQRPPFSGQSGHTQQVARVQNEISVLRQRLTEEAAARARQTYERALQRAPDDPRLRVNYSEFLEARREWKAAIAERKRVLELVPQSYFPHYALGVVLKEAGELAEAREALSRAAAIRPDHPDVRLEMGVVLGRQGEWRSARDELELARRLNPLDSRVSLYLGEVLWKLDQRDEALAALREAIRLAPSDWQPRYRLASNLAQTGRFADAATEYLEALRLNPGSARIKLGLAAVLWNLHRSAEALQLVDDVLRMDPANPTALEMRGKMGGEKNRQ